MEKTTYSTEYNKTTGEYWITLYSQGNAFNWFSFYDHEDMDNFINHNL